MNNPHGYCEYGKHFVDQHPAAMTRYRDVDNGIRQEIDICDTCLMQHISKFYPGGRIQRELLRNHPEWEQDLTSVEKCV